MTWHLRGATVDDLEPMMAIENAVYPDDAWSAQNMGAELANPHGHYLIAVDEQDAIVGYAGLLAPIGTGQGDIQTVTVSPEARRQGLARAMLQQLINEARRRGAEELFLEVRADNEPAQTLYRDFGFEPVGVRKRYYKGGIDALTMKLVVPKARTGVA
jgi:ribosomal-protein-alanine acetyltransferase